MVVTRLAEPAVDESSHFRHERTLAAAPRICLRSPRGGGWVHLVARAVAKGRVRRGRGWGQIQCFRRKKTTWAIVDATISAHDHA